MNNDSIALFLTILTYFQVTTLVASKSPQKKKGKSKRAQVLVAAVERATANFVERGQQIAAENPEIQRDMMEAVQAVQASGQAMSEAAEAFAADPCSSVKRGNMVSKMNFTLNMKIFFTFFKYFGHFMLFHFEIKARKKHL